MIIYPFFFLLSFLGKHGAYILMKLRVNVSGFQSSDRGTEVKSNQQNYIRNYNIRLTNIF